MLKPANFNPEKKYPAILYIHGGAKVLYTKVFFHEMQYLASEGYFVIYGNPRGSDGQGSDFARLLGHYGEPDFADLMKAMDTALELYPNIDADRLGVAGGSYGGIMTNWMVTHTNRFKAAVAQRSICSMVSTFGTADNGIGADLCICRVTGADFCHCGRNRNYCHRRMGTAGAGGTLYPLLTGEYLYQLLPWRGRGESCVLDQLSAGGDPAGYLFWPVADSCDWSECGVVLHARYMGAGVPLQLGLLSQPPMGASYETGNFVRKANRHVHLVRVCFCCDYGGMVKA